MSSTRSGLEALYRVSLADGMIVRVPNTSDGATSDGKPRRPGVHRAHDDSNIYRVDLRDARALGPARAIIESSRVDAAPHISPDGRSLAFVSTRGGGRTSGWRRLTARTRGE